MDKYLLHLLKEIKTIIIPGLGALTLTNEEKGEVLFMPYLKFDDGKLTTHISECEGITHQEAHNFVAKCVREIEATLNRGERYDIYQFGRFFKKADGTIAFEKWDDNTPESKYGLTESLVEQSPEIVPTKEQVTNEAVSVQKTYEATETYTEEDQWNDDLDLPPINHAVERPKKPILEKTKKDRPRKKTNLIIGMSLLLLLIGGILLVAIFYNTTERTIKHIASNAKERLVPKDGSTAADVRQDKKVTPKPEFNQSEIEPIISPKSELDEKTPNPESVESPSVLNKYHIIMGAFRVQSNAENYVVSLNQLGGSATIVTQVEGLYLVSYGSYASPEERSSHIADARKIIPQAWLMIFP
jgi:cell division protein FtsN